MWRRCAYWCGVSLIAVALLAVPSVAIAPSFAGGSAVNGSVVGGRFFVNPSHGRPIVEVSESTWRTVYWVERLWPFSALVPGLIGLFLAGYAIGPNQKPAPHPPAEPPPRVLWACMLCGVGTVALTLLCWYITHTPWVVMLVGWILFCVAGGTCGWLYYRSLHPLSNDEPPTHLC
jgi:hypothetical protein